MVARRSEKSLLKELLEEMGFSVKLDGTIEGFSNIKHGFDIIATKNDLILCFDIVNLRASTFLGIWCKALDLRKARIFLVSEERHASQLPSELRKTEDLELIFYRSLRDLEEKVRTAIDEIK